MTILTISGSTRTNSTNQMLLSHLPNLVEQCQFQRCEVLQQLPLFHPDPEQQTPLPPLVSQFQETVEGAEAVIISTPAYLHNIPAALKNAFEWLTTAGTLADKKVLAITYTPNAPRGKKAMQSLLWSLTALNARVMSSLELYHTDISFDEKGAVVCKSGEALLKEAVLLLV